MESQYDLIKGADVQDLKELLGVTSLDLMWVIGLKSFSFPMGRWKPTGERSELPIIQPSLSILVRYLLRYEDEGLIPKAPYFEDVFDKVAPFFQELSLGDPYLSKFSLLLGLGVGAANQWSKGLRSPALGTQRLLYLINRAVDKNGIKGFERYIKIVAQEAKVRDVGTLDDLFEASAWKPEAFKKKYSDPSVEVPGNLMTGADFDDLKELLGLSWWEFIWLMGKANFQARWKNKGEESFRPNTQPSVCILGRYLMEYDDEAFAPTMPDFSQVHDMLEKVQTQVRPFKKISGRVLGPLFGVSGWSFNQYRNGTKTPSPMVDRLFYVFLKRIEQEGIEQGFKQYFELVNQDIVARNLGNYDTVVRDGWQTTAFRSRYYSDK